MNGNERFKRTVLATCCVPWDERWELEEDLFRETVRLLADRGFRDLYVFGTAGEGHAVSDHQFVRVVRAFVEEVTGWGGEPMVGVISLSLPTVCERIEAAAALGCRLFQISLPNWSALNDLEVDRFFDETCARYPEFLFMHYNLGRSGRILRGSDYARLSARHPNLVATKYGAGDPEIITGLLTESPQLRHFFTELGFFCGGVIGPCALLASVSATNPKEARRYFDAVVTGDYGAAAACFRELAIMLARLRRVVGSGPHLDGAYDKIIAKVVDRRFPLRLQPPWQESTLEACDEYNAFLRSVFPHWLPEESGAS
jgi:dihydrodipicolinate synthase/N-acetylneuraminate lyase